MFSTCSWKEKLYHDKLASEHLQLRASTLHFRIVSYALRTYLWLWSYSCLLHKNFVKINYKHHFPTLEDCTVYSVGSKHSKQTKDHWELMGFWTLSIVRKSKITKHDISETGSASVLRWREPPTLLGPLDRANLNHWTLALSKGPNRVGGSLHLRTEADPVSETLCDLVTLDFRMMDKFQKPISFQCNILSSEPFRKKGTFNTIL
jgi:hypothetical protein